MNHKAGRRISIPTHDYTAAIELAVSWLGKRYLLAKPINGARHVNGVSRSMSTDGWRFKMERSVDTED